MEKSFEGRFELRSGKNIASFRYQGEIKLSDKNWRNLEGCGSYNVYVDEELIKKYADVGNTEYSGVRNVLEDLNKVHPAVTLKEHTGKNFKRRAIKYSAGVSEQSKIKIEREISRIFAENDDQDRMLKASFDEVANDCKKMFKEVESITLEYNYFMLYTDNIMNYAVQTICLASFIYDDLTIKWPQEATPESFTVRFVYDYENGKTTPVKAILTSVDILDTSNNPAYEFIRKRYITGINALSSTKTDVSTDKDKAINYYLEGTTGPWMEYDKDIMNNRRGDPTLDVPGIYMLYDSKKGHIYVGKAKQLYTRMLQHRKGGDPIPEFDYYRFTKLDPKHFKEIFLIENTAIHDLAMIFDMPRANEYKGKALSKVSNKSLGEIKLVNRVEKQTKFDDI